MAKFKKKPVEIEACVWEGDFFVNGVDTSPEWIKSALADGALYFKGQGELIIRTLEGDHHASIGDYIIKGVQGELYPCKPDIFEQTYERCDS